MRTILLLLAVALAGCGSAATEPESGSFVMKNGDLVIGLGESTTVAGLTITFRDVLEDSRCPRDVVCIWEGNARVQLDLSRSGGPEASILLNTTQPRVVVFGAQRVELADVTPYPDTRVRFARSAYRVRLRAPFLPD